MVLGVLGDFSADGSLELSPFASRSFASIDRDNFDDVMCETRVTLDFTVTNDLAAEPADFRVRLNFRRFEDFEPGQIVQQIAPLRLLLENRNEVKNLLDRVQESPELEAEVEKLVRQSGPSEGLKEKLHAAIGGHGMQRPVAPAPRRVPQAQGESLLDAVVAASDDRDVEGKQEAELLRMLVDDSVRGTVTRSVEISKRLGRLVREIDARVSRQLALAMHHPKFQKLEGSWRGLHYLVFNSETSRSLRIEVLSVSRNELAADLENVAEIEQSELFKKVWSDRFGLPDPQPFSVLIGDFEFSKQKEDVTLLQNIARIGAAAFCPFISGVSPQMFGVDDFRSLPQGRSLEKVLAGEESVEWNGFREMDASRFVALMIPRVLSRLPYGSESRPVKEFGFDEFPVTDRGRFKELMLGKLCWMNAAFVYGTILTRAFASTGWFARVRGYESGGRVEGLPLCRYVNSEGEIQVVCPCEIALLDPDELLLEKSGFLPLSYYRNTDYAVFFGAPTIHKPGSLVDSRTTAPRERSDEEISSRLPYVLASSRIVHCLKSVAHNALGTFTEREHLERYLNNWLADHILEDPKASEESRLKFPLLEAQVQLAMIPGKPTQWKVVLLIRPWLAFEELQTARRIEFGIP